MATFVLLELNSEYKVVSSHLIKNLKHIPKHKHNELMIIL